MKFTLVGNGRMGHEVASVIEASTVHSIAAVLDIDAVITPEVFRGVTQSLILRFAMHFWRT